MTDRDPLDVAVDRAHKALSDVVRIAAQHDAVDLLRVADKARSDLLDAWESAE